MEVVLWGVRGSIPNPNKANRFYGSNTTCIEVRPTPELLLIFDAGTGIRSLSKTLPASGESHIFITHAHSDHVQGLSFFAPFFNPDWTINIHLPHYLPHLPYQLFDGNSFPVSFVNLKAKINIFTMEPNTSVTLGSGDGTVRVEALKAHHPGGGYAYKVTSPGNCFLYSGDHEITADPGVMAETKRMLEGATLAIVDATYSRADYHAGWGHSTWEDWVPFAEEAGVETLVLSHHMQDRADSELDALQHTLLTENPLGATSAMQVAVAREGMRISSPGPAELDIKSSDWLASFLASLAELKEETALLASILAKSREISHADAGSIYIVEGNDLVFAYAQNDTLFPQDVQNKSMYVNMRLPILKTSIAGYVAATGTVLNLEDVRAIPPGKPFSFNDSFDKKTGYVTTSMLTLPISSSEHNILGVVQLINCQTPRTGEIRPFPDAVVDTLRILARKAAAHLEASGKVYQGVNRLLRIAVLHDPSETGPHAARVGAIAAEVYHHWADKKGICPEQIRMFKSQLRLAAMVHDIGKVGISDTLLKKPGKLTDDEFAVMKKHTNLGAEIFTADSRDIAEMAHEISLHHHQKWNGKGYPPVDGVTPAGLDIPLSARITAIADVFDALVSPRCYKEPWSIEKATALLVEEAGQHFDPELVQSFTEIRDTVTMIYERYTDPETPATEPASTIVPRPRQ